jgi:hypothetical protein
MGLAKVGNDTRRGFYLKVGARVAGHRRCILKTRPRLSP